MINPFRNFDSHRNCAPGSFFFTKSEAFRANLSKSELVEEDERSAAGVTLGAFMSRQARSYSGKSLSRSFAGRALLTLLSLSIAPCDAFANTAPYAAVTPAPIRLNEDAEDIALDLSTMFGDADQASSTLRYTVVSNSSSSLIPRATVSTTSLSIGLAKDASGTAVLRVRATDSGGLFAELSLTVIVAPVNDRPTTSGLAPISLTSTARTTTVPLFPVFADVEDADSALAFSVAKISRPTAIESARIDAATGVLTVTAAPGATGSVTLTLRATDRDGGFLERGIPAGAFRVYSNFIGTAGVHYPDMTSLGITPAQLLTNYYYLTYVNDAYLLDHIDETQWRTTLKNEVARDGRPLVMNVEIPEYFGNDAHGRDNLARLMQIAHEERPDITTIGFYRLLPERSWYEPVNYRRMIESQSLNLLDWYTSDAMKQSVPVDYSAWKERDSLYITQPVSTSSGGGTVAAKVNHVYPSLYTLFRNDRNQVRYAEAFLDATSNTLTVPSLPYANGTRLNFLRVQGGTLPTGLSPYVTYTVVGSTFSKNGSRFQISASTGGTAIDFAADGTGRFFVYSDGPWANLWEDGGVYDWLKYAEENILEARRYNKPTYAYISPSFYGAGDTYVEKEFFRWQLDSLYDLKVNGIVIYEPGKKGVSFYTAQGWYHAIAEFMRDLNGPTTNLTIELGGNSPPGAPRNLVVQ